MTNRKNTVLLPLLAFLAIVSVILTGPAAADSLDDAKRNGLVGETLRGYIAPVKAPSAETTRLVNDINQRRRAAYEDIAKKNGIPIQQVEVLTGQRIIERAPAGTFYQDSSGNWTRK
ncbi:MAG: YdbL family protein [Alphaproteobacteria bacterium]